MALDLKSTRKKIKEDPNKKILKPGRPVQYTNEKRKTITIQMYPSDIERLKNAAKDLYAGNMTMTVNEIINKFLEENKY